MMDSRSTGPCRLDEYPLLIDLLVALGEAGVASGIDKDFDIDTWIEEGRITDEEITCERGKGHGQDTA